jgi:hypothetical protein
MIILWMFGIWDLPSLDSLKQTFSMTFNDIFAVCGIMDR